MGGARNDNGISLALISRRKAFEEIVLIFCRFGFGPWSFFFGELQNDVIRPWNDGAVVDEVVFRTDSFYYFKFLGEDIGFGS